MSPYFRGKGSKIEKKLIMNSKNKMVKWGREESKIGDVIYGQPPIATCNLVLMATKMESR